MRKIIIFYNFKGSAETEWLLPIFEYLKKDYLIFTIFKNHQAFLSLKQNKTNFKIWKNISKNYYIEKKSDFFISKILIYIFNNFLKNEKIVNLLRKNIYNLSSIKKIIKKNVTFKNFQLSYFFSEFGFSSGWVDYLKKTKKVKIIHYPSTPQIYLNEIKKKYSLRGDLLFLNSFLDKKIFQKKIQRNKIFISGNPKYDPKWLNRYYKKEDSKDKIIIAYVSRFDYVNAHYKKLLEKQLIDLIEILNFLNKEVVFKLHPTKNSQQYKIFLKKYAKFKWIESSKNLIELCQNCLCLITHPFSAAGFDAIMTSRPILQLWPIVEREFKKSTSYETLKLINVSNSKDDFKIKLQKIIKKKKISHSNFKEFFPARKNTIKRILSQLKKIEKKN